MDTIKINILEDGTIKVETDRVSMPNHLSAEKFLTSTINLAGGTAQRKRKGHTHTHAHDHDHAHDHEHH